MPVGVLIVEDSRVIREMLHALLAQAGDFHVVGTAASETDAIDWLHHHQGAWGVAIVDLLLSEGSGFTLVQRCKLQPLPGKVVVFSDYVTQAIAGRCRALGADAAFAKSQVPELRAFLEEVAREAQAAERAPPAP